MSRAPLDRDTAEALLALTRRMNAAAEEHDWDRVATHDVERRALLATDRGDATGGGSLAPDTALVEALREADRNLLARTRDARTALGERSRHTRAERDVCRTYADVMKSAGSTGTSG